MSTSLNENLVLKKILQNENFYFELLEKGKLSFVESTAMHELENSTRKDIIECRKRIAFKKFSAKKDYWYERFGEASDSLKSREQKAFHAEWYFNQTEKASQPENKNSFLSRREFITKNSKNDFPTFKFVCQDLGLFVGAPALLVGESGSSKSALASYLALCVATGTSFFNSSVNKGKVLWLDYDQGQELVKTKFVRLMNGHEFDLEENSLSISFPSKRVDEKGAKEELIEACQGIDFAVIDCLRGSSKHEENSSEARCVLDMLREISELTRTCFLVIHHSGKKNKEELRGTSAFKDAISTLLIVTKNELKDQIERYTLFQAKHRLSRYSGCQYKFEDSGPIREENGQTESAKIVHFSSKLSPIKDLIINYLITVDEATGTELRQQVGGNKNTYGKELKELVTSGILILKEEGTKNLYSYNHKFETELF